MCGILGGWWRNPLPDLPSRIKQGIRALKHRGPNDHGVESSRAPWGETTLGQTRLSIIDLSTGGHQPMRSSDDRYLLVYNGEIYNYKELRQELRQAGYHFQSDSDTEVLLTCWMHWGPACLTRFKGMFAFAIMDTADGSLSLVRDAFGIKPLFYRYTEGQLVFGSELPAILALMPEDPRLDWQSAYDYLVHGRYDHGERTFIDGIRHVPPGTILTLSPQTGELSAPTVWWTPSIKAREKISVTDATMQLRERFLQNVRLHLRSDVPLGAALSGGVDSSAIVCAMRHIEPDLPINTFSFVARGSRKSEEKWVDIVNGSVGAHGHKVVVEPSELAADLDDMIRAQGEPFGSTSIYAQYRVFKLARENGITVALEGQGADELLAGYNGYPAHRIVSLLQEGRLANAWTFLNSQKQWPGRPTSRAIVQEAAALMLPDAIYHRARHASGRRSTPSWLNVEQCMEAGVITRFPRDSWLSPERGRRVMGELAQSLTRRGLGWLLRHGDRNSMRFSIESRVPFLTTDMADFLLGLPEDHLISAHGETKHIFRAAMRGIVPDAILDRRDKIGFETPELEWLRALAPQIRGWLSENTGASFLDRAQLITEFDAVVDGRKPFNWQTWRWINFQRWMHVMQIRA
ncbi:asparagine synthase (glutamine-hydrolyzing) [Achromobacter xylosoxidans]|uniref:asparagine synthase (glutamine-hydrolyzing) n=1 Tax=Alcaligenes xylosoxydans xylosoxydans TaxID=85698 RepID=UPI001565556F|nr:asparagine synthase (glutamine-hydrolyzing) [Achromobacter xylosoxidans]QKI70406.1 asparagine synthase (glutamine-hydrolyzing) [Achromobacter xylosoxidans]